MSICRRHLLGVMAGVLGAGVIVLSQQERAVLVRGGTFRMGTPASAVPALKARYNVDFPGVFEDEVPERQVTVSDFRMDRTEVTNARFAEFVAAQPEWSPGRVPPGQQNGHYLEHWLQGRPPVGKADHPVVFVTWPSAQAFCAWAGGRLPTEAEWEYAARAGREQEFPWGDELPSPDRANYGASGFRDTRAVASYPASAFGLYDVAGNVWEFTADAWTAPGRRVLRGGSYGGGPVNLRTRWRDSHEELNAVAFVGFRCASSDRL